MTIFGYVAIVSLASTVSSLLIIGLTLAGSLFLIDRARLIVYRVAVDYLELSARHDALKDDRARRELTLAEAGIELRVRRLELQGKRLELLNE